MISDLVTTEKLEIILSYDEIIEMIKEKHPDLFQGDYHQVDVEIDMTEDGFNSHIKITCQKLVGRELSNEG